MIKNEIDILLCILPPMVLSTPIIGPYLLYTYLIKNNFTAEIFDLNLDLFKDIADEDPFNVQKNTLKWSIENNFNKYYKKLIVSRDWPTRLLNKKSEWIGFHIHSQENIPVVEMLCKQIKSIKPDQKIVIGGPYSEYVGKELIDKKLIDSYIIGYAENAIIDLLKGNYKSVGKRHMGSDMNELPIVDYAKVDFSLYDSLFVELSRSCIRNCKFCETTSSKYGKYRYKSAEKLVNEIINYYELYGIKRFIFSDNTVNGNINHVEKIADLLLLYYKENNIDPFYFRSFFIIRHKQNRLDNFFSKVSNAGFNFIKVGVESGSYLVRRHMGKFFTNEDIFSLLEQCKRFNIKTRLQMIIGYPYEGEYNFKETLNMFDEIKERNLDSAIDNVCIVPFLFLGGCSLYNDSSITKDKRFPDKEIREYWIRGDNDAYTRLDRYLRLEQKLNEFSITVDGQPRIDL